MSRGLDDELLPWWWERQLDPTSPDVVPGPESSQNTTHRDWVLLGTTGAAERAVVDPRGAVTPWPEGWSLDWWVGAEDSWHLPSRAAAVRQHLVGAAPVVETIVRVPGGEVRHRAWAVAAGSGIPDGGAVVVEVENASAVPVAVALAVRPFNPLGRSPITAITLDELVLAVDGYPAIVLPKAPSRSAVGSAAVDAVTPTMAGEATSEWPDGGARCAQGGASAALLYPLPHTATLRVLLPLVPARPVASRRRSEGPVAAAHPSSAPDAERVASGWEAQTQRALRMEVPEPRLADAVAAARRAALLHAAGEDVGSWPPSVVGGLDTAELCVALDQHGLHAEAERLLVGFADRQGLDGSFAGEGTRADAGAAWLHALGFHVRATGDPSVAHALVGPVAKAAHHLRRRLVGRVGRGARQAHAVPGLFPPGQSPSWLAPRVGSTYHDALWGRRGLLDAAFLLTVADQADAAAEPRGVAEPLTERLLSALAAQEAWGAGPCDGTSIGALATAIALAATAEGPGGGAAGEPSTVANPGPGAFAAALDGCLDASPATVRGAVWHEVGHAGLSPRLTAWLGVARALAGRTDSAEQVAWLLEVGAPTWTWPELVHPRSGGGCAGEGHHAAATAAVLQMARRLLVAEEGSALVVLSAVPDAWLGQPIEVHGAPTARGLLSFALRWHGERPALLWELEPHTDASIVAALADEGSFSLRAPGLDPTWSTSEPRGEALLAAPRPRPVPENGEPTDDAGSAASSTAPTTSDPDPAPRSAREPAAEPPTSPPTGRDWPPPQGGGSFS